MRTTFVRLLLCAGILSVLVPVPGVMAENKPGPDGNRTLQIIKRARLGFPPRLIGAGITSGEVRLYLDVDAEGKLADHLIVAYTHYEFANAISRTVGRWRFLPAIVNGRAVASTVALNIRFEVNGVMVSEQRTAEAPPMSLRDFMFHARSLNDLDRLPKPVTVVAPTNPAAAGEPAITGRARVDFFIDEQGRVRMPVVASADDERLGWAALAAIAKWQFEVPVRGGFPVLARASQVFTFAADE